MKTYVLEDLIYLMLTGILSRIDVLNMYSPALILFDTNSWGFSTKLDICPVSGWYITTPYLDGSSTLVTYGWQNRKLWADDY